MRSGWPLRERKRVATQPLKVQQLSLYPTDIPLSPLQLFASLLKHVSLVLMSLHRVDSQATVILAKSHSHSSSIL